MQINCNICITYIRTHLPSATHNHDIIVVISGYVQLLYMFMSPLISYEHYREVILYKLFDWMIHLYCFQQIIKDN